MSTPSTTCGARLASATTPRWSGRRSAPIASTAGTRCSIRRSRRSSPGAASHAWTCQRTFSMVARIFLGRDANSQSTEDLAAAEALLKRARPYIRYFNTAQLVNDLASGEVCVAFSWNGLRHPGAGPRRCGVDARRDRVCDPEGGIVHLVRHGSHSGRRAASRQRACIPELPDGARGHREGEQRDRIRQRQSRLAAVPEARVRDDPAVYPREEVKLETASRKPPSRRSTSARRAARGLASRPGQ